MIDGINQSVLDERNLQKLLDLKNTHVLNIVKEYILLCKPAKVSIITDDPKDIEYVRKLAISAGEESPLAMNGHTIHFDGIKDLARDKGSTKVLIPEGYKLSKYINSMEREEGLKEIFELLDGIMSGKEMLVRFFCLGPINSRFSIPALQITDSTYVAHSEDLLYRRGYEEFKRLNGSDKFFHFIHSAGELEGGVSKNNNKRRIYIDLKGERVFSVNTQYAGNTVGLKKLAFRLGIQRSDMESWLCEHMFLMGVHPLNKQRTTYFMGAFPSGCGKTSTAMIPGQTIVGDDLTYIKPDQENNMRAVNVESGIFGIIEDVNPIDDPVIYNAITTPREVIFSNVLVVDGVPYWLGMGTPIPEKGINFSGEWFKGKKDENGAEILPAHKNARYTIRLSELENVDPKLEDPEGCIVDGIIYGGRDSDTSVPVVQSFDWSHGVFMGAALESETTATIIGKIGERVLNPMANLDFVVIPLGKYINNHLQFGKKLKRIPLIFSTNYFLKENGKYVNEKVDKKIWLLWMEGRVHGEYDAIKTPVGFIPKYEDVKALFQQVFNKEYTIEDYVKAFSIRVDKFLEKLDRVEKFYKVEHDVPDEFFKQLDHERESLLAAKQKYGKSVISPLEL